MNKVYILLLLTAIHSKLRLFKVLVALYSLSKKNIFFKIKIDIQWNSSIIKYFGPSGLLLRRESRLSRTR